MAELLADPILGVLAASQKNPSNNRKLSSQQHQATSASAERHRQLSAATPTAANEVKFFETPAIAAKATAIDDVALFGPRNHAQSVSTLVTDRGEVMRTRLNVIASALGDMLPDQRLHFEALAELDKGTTS